MGKTKPAKSSPQRSHESDVAEFQATAYANSAFAAMERDHSEDSHKQKLASRK